MEKINEKREKIETLNKEKFEKACNDTVNAFEYQTACLEIVNEDMQNMAKVWTKLAGDMPSNKL